MAIGGMKLAKCTGCNKRQPVLGFKLCYDCIQGGVKTPPRQCNTKGCVGYVPTGATECNSCSSYTAAGYPGKFPVVQGSRTFGKSDGTVGRDELEVVQQDVQNVRAVLAHILDILANLDTKVLNEFPKAQTAFNEAKALLGEVSRTEVIKDLKKWEGELDGDEDAPLEGD